MVNDPNSADSFLAQDAATDPGDLKPWIAGIPESAQILCETVQGLLVHDFYGDLEDPDFASRQDIDRTTLPLSSRLAQLRQTDERPPQTTRPSNAREVGTCRDFALMLCGFLRHRGTPARVRCGFAAYFRKPGENWWDDHWITEYWDDETCFWRRADAQITPALAKQLKIADPAHDLRPESFLTGSEAWLAARSGKIAAERFRCGAEAHGHWFIAVNVIRDRLALQGRYPSTWDGWRAAKPEGTGFSPAYFGRFDTIAAQEIPLETIPEPFWDATL